MGAMTQWRATRRGPRRQDLREYVPVLGALAMGLALTILVTALLNRYERNQWEQNYHHRTEIWSEAFHKALEAYGQMGRLTAAFASNSQTVTEDEFRRFTAPLLQNGPPVSLLGWHPRIGRQTEDTVSTPKGTVPITEVGDEHVATAFYPLRFATPAGHHNYGYSPTGSEDPRAQALAQAVTRGKPVTAENVPVPGNGNAGQGIVTYHPVFRPAEDQQTERVAGVIAVGFRPGQLMASVSKDDAGLWVTVHHPLPAEPPQTLYQGNSAGRWTTHVDPANAPSETVRTFDARLADMPLEVTLAPSRSLLAERESWLPWLAALAGFIATALTTMFLLTQARRTQSVEQQVSEGTHALLEAQSNMIRNAEAREKTLQALSDSEARYRLLADNATDIISRVSTDGTLLYVSPAVRNILGYDPDELTGHSVYELLPRFDEPDIRRQAQEALRNPGVYTVSYQLNHARGHAVWLEITLRILTAPATGDATEIISVSRDITARRAAEQALRESEALFRTVFEDAHVGMALFSPADGSLLRVNRTLCEMLGYSRSELEEKTLADVTHPADQDVAPSEIQQVISGDKDGFFEEKRLLNRGGTTVWVFGNTNLIRDSEGEPRYFISQIQDISGRKRAEEQLARISHQRDLVLNAAAEGIYGVDMDGYTTFVNEAAARMLGYEASELIGVRIHSVIHASDPDITKRRWEESRVFLSITDQETYHVEEERFHDHKGRPLHVQYVVSPIIENGRSTGAVVVFWPLEDWQKPAVSSRG